MKASTTAAADSKERAGGPGERARCDSGEAHAPNACVYVAERMRKLGKEEEEEEEGKRRKWKKTLGHSRP